MLGVYFVFSLKGVWGIRRLSSCLLDEYIILKSPGRSPRVPPCALLITCARYNTFTALIHGFCRPAIQIHRRSLSSTKYSATGTVDRRRLWGPTWAGSIKAVR